jgi:hypothetical protein
MSSRRCWLNASTATSYNTLPSGNTIRCPTLPGNHCTTSLVTRHSWSFKSLGRSHRLLKGEQCKRTITPRAITPRAITPRAITPRAITPGAITSHRLGPSLYKPRSGSFSTLYRRELVFLNRLKFQRYTLDLTFSNKDFEQTVWTRVDCLTNHNRGNLEWTSIRNARWRRCKREENEAVQKFATRFLCQSSNMSSRVCRS